MIRIERAIAPRDLPAVPERGEIGMRGRDHMKVVAEDGGLEHVDRDMHGEDTHPVHQPAAPFLFLREKEAAHAARDAVADDGFRVIKEEFSREGHGDGDDAVVKMPTPEKLCFFLQMNAISWGRCVRAGDAHPPGESCGRPSPPRVRR